MERETKLDNGLVRVIGFFKNKDIYYKYTKLNDRFHGEEVWYHRNGKVDTIKHWVDGKLNGEEVRFDENGVIKLRRNWVDNLRQGTEFRYYGDGTIVSKVEYVNDHEVSDEVWCCLKCDCNCGK